jgi:hypothetical protein
MGGFLSSLHVMAVSGWLVQFVESVESLITLYKPLKGYLGWLFWGQRRMSTVPRMLLFVERLLVSPVDSVWIIRYPGLMVVMTVVIKASYVFSI